MRTFKPSYDYSMADTTMYRLCQPITQTGWIKLPLSNWLDKQGIEWTLRLFQPEDDVDILQAWTLLGPFRKHGGISGRDLLIDAYRDIARCDDMQAFMIWHDRLPIAQIEVVDANQPLAEVYIPEEGAYVVYITNSLQLREDSLVTAIALALRFFFQFPELKALYLPDVRLEPAQRDALFELGFIRTTLGAQGSAEVMTLERSEYENRGDGAGGTLMK